MKKFPNIPNKDLTHFGYRAEPYFTSYMIGGGLTNIKNLKKYFGLNHPTTHIFVNFEMFNTISGIEAFTKELHRKLLKAGPEYVTGIVKNCFQTGNNLLNISKKINKKAKTQNLQVKQIIKLLDQYTKTAYDYCGYYAVAWFEKAETDLAKTIAEKYAKNKKETENIFKIITTPSRLTSAEKEQDDFLKLAAQDSKLWRKKATLHASNYGHLSVRYFIGDPWTKTDVLLRLKNTNKKHAAKLLKQRILYRNQIEKNLKLFLMGANKKDQNQIKQIRDIVFLRTQRADFYHHSSFYLQPLVKTIAEHLNVTYRDLLNFSPPEVINALKGKFDIQSHVKARRTCLVSYHHGISLCIEGEKALKYVQQRPVLQHKIKLLTSLSGNPAFPGKITGKAKIVISNKDIHKVQKGDILIATMTTPNFIAAMEKASGFVTNEGGILCHAAIISREMKKPCIIGTKIATRVFKDGDMVEVDANKGVVKKL